MARRGSFGGGINPFGSSAPSGLSAYNVGYSLAQLDAYRISVGWQNGTVSDDEYLASLQKQLDAALPNSRDQISAQNQLDDAKYTIGRQKAQDKGLDALIAFDELSLARMRSDNHHADDIRNALASELAQRRNRDYSKIVDDVNNGKASLQSLLDWVNQTISTLPSDAPDKDNWTQTQTSVAAQIQTQKDSQVYQDYNNQRMSGKDFLAYIQSRRDQYDPSSPAYADWSRKLEDATKNVKDTELSKQDTAFFDAYNEGHKSDADYLTYIKTRLDGMDPSDPQYETWRHRYVTTAFSLAEDQLRFAVNQGTKPVSDLVSFYQSYALTLNPGSAEWRSTQDKITSLQGRRSGGGGGGSSSGGGTAITADKVIDGHYTLDTVLHDLSLPANATKADVDMFNANYNRLSDAHQHGDKVWLFIDPNNPGATIPGQNPDGSPMLDANGKPIMVRGSGYLPVTTEALGNLNILDAQYHSSVAAAALQGGDRATFYYQTQQSDEALNRSRNLALADFQKTNDLAYQNAKSVIALDLQSGNLSGAYNTTMAMLAAISNDLNDPTMDATRRSNLQKMADELAAQPFMPQIDDTGRITGGAIVLDSSGAPIVGNDGQPLVNPGWHFVLADGTNYKTNQWVQDLTPGASQETWSQDHITVTAPFMGTSVQGDTAVRRTNASAVVWANVNGTWQQIPVPGIQTYETQYLDENGRLVTAYSIDGHTWLTTTNYYAGPPQLQLGGTYSYDKNTGTLTDMNGAEVGTFDGVSFKFSVAPPFDFYGVNPTMLVPGDKGGNIGGGGYTVRYSPDGTSLDTRDLSKGPVYTTPTGLVVGDYQDSRLPTPTKTGSAPNGYVDAQGHWTPAKPTLAPAVQTYRGVTQPGQTNQDIAPRPPTFAQTLAPSNTSLPGTFAPKPVTKTMTPVLAAPIVPYSERTTYTPPLPTVPIADYSDSRLPTVTPPPPPVVQTPVTVTQPGQTNQDITPSKPKPAPKPPVVIQPKPTIKAV